MKNKKKYYVAHDGRVTSFSISKLIPNFVTVLSAIVGLCGLNAALRGKFEIAVLMLAVAAILDGVDGRLARSLGATTAFGSALDSLCDTVNFGVCSALVVYIWTSQSVKFFGLASMLSFVVAIVLRLARFNTTIFDGKKSQQLKDNFFQGIPAPAGAMLSIMPICASIEFDIAPAMLANFTIVNTFILSFLLVSSIPTISIKKLRLQARHASWFIPLMVVILISAITEPVKSMMIIASLYVISIPVSTYFYYKMKSQLAKKDISQS